MEFRVQKTDGDVRIDAFLAQQCPTCSRAQIKKAIENGDVWVNDRVCQKASKAVVDGDCVRFSPPAAIDPLKPVAEAIPLHILYRDDHLFVIDKPAGLVVHPGAGHTTGTLVNALLQLDPAIKNVGEPDRPGIVHRLDAETSGLLLVARSNEAYETLVGMFSKHDIHRQYWAICHAPKLPDSGTFDTPFGRHPTQRVKFTSFANPRLLPPNEDALKRAITHYRVLSRNPSGFALVTCQLETGRTHQIRVHLSEHGAPLLGDQLYAPTKIANHRAIPRLALHAGKLVFNHPITQQVMTFEVPLPDDMKMALHALNLSFDDTDHV